MSFSQITVAEVTKNKPWTDTLGIKMKTNFDALNDRSLGIGNEKNKMPYDDGLELPPIRKLTVVTGALTLGAHDIIIGDTSGGAFTITLPAAGVAGKNYTVWRKGANDLTVDTTGADTVEGIASVILGADAEVSVYCDDGGTNWERISTNLV